MYICKSNFYNNKGRLIQSTFVDFASKRFNSYIALVRKAYLTRSVDFLMVFLAFPA